MKRAFLFALACLAAAPAAPALAADAPLLGNFGDWQAFKTTQGGKQVCLVSSKPTKMVPAAAKRSDVFVMISNFQDGNVKNQIQVLAGYPYKDGSTATLTVGSSKFSLFTQGENAWARDKAADDQIVAALRKGSTATVDGVSQRGTKTTDSYSLKGISAALDAIGKACSF